MEPVPSTVVKTFPARGPLQQFRFSESTAFRCFRCGETKKSKLLVVYAGDWSRKLCNGCYGRMLSIYDVKAGTAPDDERAEQLLEVLLSLVSVDEQQTALRVFRASENRAQRLCPETQRFLATAEHVAGGLESHAHLEWSPAVICLCKAVEVEIVGRILQPLATFSAGSELSIDKADKDIGRVASYCLEPQKKPPELGTFAHFLQTVIHSEQRRQSSILIRNFLRLAAEWPGSDWLLRPEGLHATLSQLITAYRNRAAHTDELSKADYVGCRSAAIGVDGLIWRLLVSTEIHR